MQIEISNLAKKQLRKAKSDSELYKRLNNALDDLAANPNLGKLLEGDLKGVRAWRVGDWRILYQVYKSQLRILIIRIAPRKQVYRK